MDSSFVMTVCHFGTKYAEILSLLPPPMSLVPLSSDQPPQTSRQITVLAQGLYLSYITDHSTRTGSLPLHCAIFQGARQVTRPPSDHVESLFILVEDSMYVPFYVYTFLCLCVHLLCIHLSMYTPFYVNGNRYVQCCPWRHHVCGVSPPKALSVALHRLVICEDRIKGVVRAIICH